MRSPGPLWQYFWRPCVPDEKAEMLAWPPHSVAKDRRVLRREHGRFRSGALLNRPLPAGTRNLINVSLGGRVIARSRGSST